MTLLLLNLQMSFLSKHGRSTHVFYMNIVYTIMTLLGALILASLNADYGEGDDAVPRYTKCRLDGSTNKTTGCLSLNTEETDQLETLFGISVVVIIMNSILGLWSIANHFGDGVGIKYHFWSQPFLSAINLGLFAGLVGWYDFSEGLTEKLNVENNIYFDSINPYNIALVGLVASILDLVVFTAFRFGYTDFIKHCGANADQNN